MAPGAPAVINNGNCAKLSLGGNGRPARSRTLGPFRTCGFYCLRCHAARSLGITIVSGDSRSVARVCSVRARESACVPLPTPNFRNVKRGSYCRKSRGAARAGDARKPFERNREAIDAADPIVQCDRFGAAAITLDSAITYRLIIIIIIRYNKYI